MRLIYVLVMTLAAAPATLAFDILQPLPEAPPVPADNPVTEAKVHLGKRLFFDPRLSRDMDTTCNDCHNLMASGDGEGLVERHAKGRLKRSAPPLYNVGFQTVLFWDGRAPSLEAAVTEHLFDNRVMALPNEAALIRRLEALPGYPKAFAEAFEGDAPVSADNAAKAVASFIRTLLTPDSAFDHYIRGDDNAISEKAKRGLELFDDVGCLACHFGVNFAGPAPGPAMGLGDGFYELFPNHLGSSYDRRYGIAKDLGRYYVTKDKGHKHLFRVPPLRNIAVTAPYFHNGSVERLDEAVRVMAKTQLRRELSEEEVAAIVAFLETLTGRYPAVTQPRLPEAVNRAWRDVSGED